MPAPARRHIWLLPAVVILGLASAALEGFGIGLVIPMLSIILDSEVPASGNGLLARLQSVGSGLDDGTRLGAIAAAVFVLITLKNLVSVSNSLISAYIYGHAGHSVRKALSKQLLTVGFPFLRQQEPGRLLNILSNESWIVADAVNAALSMVISACATLVLATFLFALSWEMTLFVALGVSLISLFHAFVAAKLRVQGRVVAERNNTLASRMLHLAHAGQLIRVFNMEEREREVFDSASEGVRNAALSVQTRLAMLGPLTEVLYAGLFLSVVISAWAAKVSFPLLAAFVVLLYRLQPYVRGVQASWGQLQSQLGSVEEVSWLLDPQGKPVKPEGNEPSLPLRESISFRAVGFAYRDTLDRSEEIVLNGATFDIKVGRSTALIGRSGAGKTTVVNLLCRLADPTSGEITVDGAPLRHIQPAAWRSRVAVASQDLELVDDTILANIVYGSENLDQQEAEVAAKLAEAHDFITALPEGYCTVVGYRGLNLSAGQRQRIALARAMLRKPDLLILDEATNAVDGLSESAILATLRSRAGGGTTILISHHRATISCCDDIVVLGDGLALGGIDLAKAGDFQMEDLYSLTAGQAPHQA